MARPMPRYTEIDLGFCRLCSLLHPARRRAPVRKHSPLRSCTGEGELGFWEELHATAQGLHHGSSSWTISGSLSDLSSTSSPSRSCCGPCRWSCYTSTETVRSQSGQHVPRVCLAATCRC